MNRRMVFSTVGKMVTAEAAMLVLPLLCAVFYGESCAWSILITMGISLALGQAMTLLSRPRTRVIYAKEGFCITALAWVAMSAVGALPFFLSGEIPDYIDAFFETVSGFTTTGASILTDVEAMSRGLLFWRSFTHWVGGMGVLVFVMAIVPSVSDRSIHIMRAEMPGPVVGKIVPKARDTASLLYKIYIAMTVLEIVLLLCGGMPVFDSLILSFGTAGTGGFGIKADSIAGYSPYLQWVITVFMLLFGVNFNVYYLLLIRRFRAASQSTELWVYLGIVLASAGLISVNIMPMYATVGETIRHAAFQVSSIITTTGFATVDFDLWPGFSKGILLLLMFVGACAGSTGGGIKVSRVTLLFKSITRQLRHLVHPRSVSAVKFEGKTVEKETMDGVGTYLAAYLCCFAAIVLLLCLDDMSFVTHFSAAAACFNNIGPGMDLVGPTLSYVGYTDFSKLLLSFAMLLGRLEIYPLLIALIPGTWRRK